MPPRRSEYKRGFCPEEGRFVYRHIYGEGIFDGIKRIFGKAAKRAATTVADKAATKAAEKVAEVATQPPAAGGDKIVELLRASAGRPAKLTTEQQLQRLLRGGAQR